jgi:hypothetical protein
MDLGKKMTGSEWSVILDGAKKMLSDPSIKDLICSEYDDPASPPRLTKDFIAFNGKDDAGHETFYVAPDRTGFAFCKTAQKPYDTAVTACLILMKSVLKDKIRISSDGDASDWVAGLRLYNKLFATGTDIDVVERWLNESNG